MVNERLRCFVAIFCLSILCFNLGKAEGDVPGLGEGGNYGGQGVDGPELGGYDDPAQIVAKALLCFNDKFIYKTCVESYRLDQSGYLHVPPEYTNEYCTGPCLEETNLVLDCIHNILNHFTFYNRATIRDIHDTIHAGCSYGPERGNFNVDEHITAYGDGASTVNKQMMIRIVVLIIGGWFFVRHV